MDYFQRLCFTWRQQSRWKETCTYVQKGGTQMLINSILCVPRHYRFLPYDAVAWSAYTSLNEDRLYLFTKALSNFFLYGPTLYYYYYHHLSLFAYRPSSFLVDVYLWTRISFLIMRKCCVPHYSSHHLSPSFPFCAFLLTRSLSQNEKKKKSRDFLVIVVVSAGRKLFFPPHLMRFFYIQKPSIQSSFLSQTRGYRLWSIKKLS